jgi:predicted NUDIX family NTP pyrophosphohydrolase
MKRHMAAKAKKSAGILLYRRAASGAIEVLLAHPGGPFWTRKDEQAWSIPKGEFSAEEPLDAARRELTEETGAVVGAAATPVALAPVKQPSGKVVHAFAVEQDFDVATLRSNTFTMEWPPRSRREQEFPEVDRVAWFGLDEARRKIQRGQEGLLDQLLVVLGQAVGKQG